MIAVGSMALVAACGGDPKATPSTATVVPPGTLTVTAGQARTFNFDDTASGQAPKDTTSFSGKWLVEDATDAPSPGRVLCQRETATFPAIRLGADTFGDVRVSTRFKAISGSEDQAAGVMVRVVNDRNYYVARANVLEGSVNIYIYENGSRSLLAEGKADIRQSTWHELTLDIHGTALTASLDGHQTTHATDARFPTGGVGLWTKADSQTCFDSVTATAN